MKPLNGYVAIKIHDKEAKTTGGILLPEELQAINPKGTITALSPRITDLAVGDEVYYYERSGYSHDGIDLVHIDQIVAKVNNACK